MLDYSKITPLVNDLFKNSDAESVEIGRGKNKIKITRAAYNVMKQNQTVQNNPTININANTNNTNNVTINTQDIITKAIDSLKAQGVEDSEIKKVEERLHLLEKESKKKSPDKNFLAENFKWALEYGRDLLQIILPLFGGS